MSKESIDLGAGGTENPLGDGDAEPFEEYIAREHSEQETWQRKAARWFRYRIGYARCRDCAYLAADGDRYHGMRNSPLFSSGHCSFSKDSASSQLNTDDLRTYHRCRAFLPVLYNFKGIALDAEKIEELRAKRKNVVITVSGWLVAVLVALMSIGLSQLYNQ